MITSLLLGLAYSALNLVISWLPTGTGFPQAAHDAAVTLGGYLGILSPIAPVETLLTLTGLILLIELSLFGFRTFRWVVSHVPYIGGRA